jgi:hypothetical protein
VRLEEKEEKGTEEKGDGKRDGKSGKRGREKGTGKGDGFIKREKGTDLLKEKGTDLLKVRKKERKRKEKGTDLLKVRKREKGDGFICGGKRGRIYLRALKGTDSDHFANLC